MQLEDIRVIVAGAEPYTTLQASINAAVSKNSAVIIPAWYSGADTYTNASNIPVIDMRVSSSTGISVPGAITSTGTTKSATVSTAAVVMNGVRTGILAAAATAAPVTAAAGGVFTSALDAPGGSALEGVVFKVKATGWVTFPAGTYTATVQPLIYASKTVGFTASAAAAIVSAAAISMTIASATAATYTTWESEVEISGNSTSGRVAGRSSGMMLDANNAQTLVTQAVLVQANSPTAIDFSATTPIEFLTGVTLGAGSPATSVSTLGKFYLES